MLCLSLSGSSTTLRSSGSLRLGTVSDLINCSVFFVLVGHAKCLLASLLLCRLRTVDAVIITHSHADAIGGLPPLLTLYRVVTA